jgi:hypothetical protein
MKPLEPIVNLNFLNKENLIIDDKNRVFVLMSKGNFSDGNASLALLQVSDKFVTWNVKLPIACDENYVFTSPFDESFNFKFYDTGISVSYLHTQMNILIDKELKI